VAEIATAVDAAAELYALPLDQFTAARNELAARLKKAKQPREADAIRKLAKPSLTAWALDQVAHRQPALVERLLDAGEALRQAQQGLLAGQNAAAFRQATEEQKVAIQKVVEAASDCLQEDGHTVSKTTQDRLESTLRAAAADPQHGELLRRGTLAEDLNPAGFGGLEGAFGDAFAGFGAAPPRARPAVHSREPASEEPDIGSDVLQARAAIATLKRQLEVLRAHSADAEREAAASRQAAHKADLAANAARRVLEDAEHQAEDARGRQEAAAQALEYVRREIDQTADDLAEAEQNLDRIAP
jgi:hypothetical protein